MEVKILQADALWRDVQRIANGSEYISVQTIKELLDNSCEANLEMVVHCNRCLHGNPMIFADSPKQYVCLKHKCIIENADRYYCASGEWRGRSGR